MKYKIVILALLISIIILPSLVPADEPATKPIEIFVFYNQGCPHCKTMMDYINGLKMDYPQIQSYNYELSTSEQGKDLLAELAEVYDATTGYVPIIFIGDVVIIDMPRHAEHRCSASALYSETTHQKVFSSCACTCIQILCLYSLRGRSITTDFANSSLRLRSTPLSRICCS